MKVCVIGSGYVGLVTGACLADFGNQVVCVDKDKKKVCNLKRAEIDFYELGLQEMVKRNIKAKRLSFVTDLPAGVKFANIIFIAVGTPPQPDGKADLSALEAVVEGVAHTLKKTKSFRVLVLKSTVPVGTGDKVVGMLRKNGVKSKYFEVVSNPEFLREGKSVYDFLHPDRIIVGTGSNKTANIISELYRPLNARIVFMDRRSAELTKYAANAFLANKISFINEVANICERLNADVKQVAEGMGFDKRIGSQFLRAGIGYGGSCLSKDVAALTFLSQQSGYEPAMLKSVNLVNLNQRKLFGQLILQVLQGVKGKTIGIWGLSFKPQTDDLRDAPSLTIIDSLLRAGAKIRAYDPMTNNKAQGIMPNIEYCDSPYDVAKGCEAIVVITEWNEFREVDLERVKRVMKKPIIIDGRNIYDPKLVRSFGLKYYCVGRNNK